MTFFDLLWSLLAFSSHYGFSVYWLEVLAIGCFPGLLDGTFPDFPCTFLTIWNPFKHFFPLVFPQVCVPKCHCFLCECYFWIILYIRIILVTIQMWMLFRYIEPWSLNFLPLLTLLTRCPYSESKSNISKTEVIHSLSTLAPVFPNTDTGVICPVAQATNCCLYHWTHSFCHWAPLTSSNTVLIQGLMVYFSSLLTGLQLF